MWPNPVCVWPATDSSEGLSNITKCCNADQYLGWLMLRSYIASAPESALTLCLASLEPSLTGTWVSSVNGFDWHHETASHLSQIRSPESKSPVLQAFLFSSDIDWLTQQEPHASEISKNPDVRADSSPLYFLSNTLGASREEWQTHTLSPALFCFSYSILHTCWTPLWGGNSLILNAFL